MTSATFERYYGCRHPAWPDPLFLPTFEQAQAWYDEHRQRHPRIFVRREIVHAAVILGPEET